MEEVIVILRGFDSLGEQVDQLEYVGTRHPEIVFLEWMDYVRKAYPSVVRITMDVAF